MTKSISRPPTIPFPEAWMGAWMASGLLPGPVAPGPDDLAAYPAAEAELRYLQLTQARSEAFDRQFTKSQARFLSSRGVTQPKLRALFQIPRAQEHIHRIIRHLDDIDELGLVKTANESDQQRYERQCHLLKRACTVARSFAEAISDQRLSLWWQTGLLHLLDRLDGTKKSDRNYAPIERHSDFTDAKGFVYALVAWCNETHRMGLLVPSRRLRSTLRSIDEVDPSNAGDVAEPIPPRPRGRPRQQLSDLLAWVNGQRFRIPGANRPTLRHIAKHIVEFLPTAVSAPQSLRSKALKPSTVERALQGWTFTKIQDKKHPGSSWTVTGNPSTTHKSPMD